MAKRARRLNIDKLIKEGRGQGIGYGYKSWIKIQDVPSLGRSTRLRGIKQDDNMSSFLIWRKTTFIY